MKETKKQKLLRKANALVASFVRMFGTQPSCATCEIEYKDDNTKLAVMISLYDQTPNGWKDDDIFYYTSGVNDLCSLADEQTGEDFILTDICSVC